jgi:hypothetical protein
MSNDAEVFHLSNREVSIWINEGGAVSLKAVDRHGDPVELSEEEALEVAQILNRLVSKLRS